jgi:hypothetical protein
MSDLKRALDRLTRLPLLTWFGGLLAVLVVPVLGAH